MQVCHGAVKAGLAGLLLSVTALTAAPARAATALKGVTHESSAYGVISHPFRENLQQVLGHLPGSVRRTVGGLEGGAERADPTVASLGYSVSVSGNMAIVGAPGVRDGSGSVFMFARSGRHWHHAGTIADPRGTAMDEFGWSVGISATRSGTDVVIGATDDNNNSDVVYVYAFSAGTWHQQAALADPGASNGDNFGDAVAISGSTVVVGSTCINNHSGVSYIYARSGSTWNLQATLPDPDGNPNDEFGTAVAISGATAVISAADENSGAGVAYIFGRGSGGTWSRRARLADPLAHSGDLFGYSVAAIGTAAIIGAPDANSGRGIAYVYALSGKTWKRQARLADPTNPRGAHFGYSVAISGSRVLIGRPSGGRRNCGDAWDFGRSGRRWIPREVEVSPACISGQKLGFSLSLSGTTAYIGAPNRDGSIGAFYIFAIL